MHGLIVEYSIFKLLSLLLTLLCSAILCSCTPRIGHNLSSTEVENTEYIWTELRQTPSAEQKFTPQGLTFIDGYLYLAESHDDRIGMVYQIDSSDNMQTTHQFRLPNDAVHTSGLAWDGQYLWAVDYASYKLYQIDLGKSISTGEAVVINEFQIGLDGPSAITYFVWNHAPYLALSDFRNSKRTYIIPHGPYKHDIPITQQALFSYKNKTFSQGLAADSHYLYEAINKIGTDVIYQLDLCKLFEHHDFDQAITGTIPAPSKMVEDLAIGDGKLWTSDESTYKIYTAPLSKNTKVNTCQKP